MTSSHLQYISKDVHDMHEEKCLNNVPLVPSNTEREERFVIMILYEIILNVPQKKLQ